MATAAKKQKKQWVVAKGDKYATVGGGFGLRPKVYDTAAAAKYDIDTKPRLAGGVVMPYTTATKAGFDAEANKVNAAAAAAPGKAPGPADAAEGKFATTTKSKAMKGKSAKAGPKRAAAGK